MAMITGESREYHIDSEDLHSFFVRHNELVEDYAVLYEQIITVKILADCCEAGKYNQEYVLAGILHQLDALYDGAARMNRHVESCNSAMSRMFGR